jgi:hypothetical protein
MEFVVTREENVLFSWLIEFKGGVHDDCFESFKQQFFAEL